MSRTSKNSRKTTVALIAVLGLVVATIATSAAGPADAWTHINCKYAGTSPQIGYRFHSVESDNVNAVNFAQAAWDDTDSPGFFWQDSGSDPELDIYDANYSTTAWAWVDYAEHACSGSSGDWNSNETDLHIVIDSTSGLSTAELRIVMIHELGHAYGLGHSNITCTGAGPAVMRQGTGKFACAGTAPWNNDVVGVQQRY